MHRLTLAISLALFAMSAHAAAQTSEPAARDAKAPSTANADEPSTALRFGPLRVQGQQAFRYQEGMSLDAPYIRSTNTGNSDIGTLLRINPAVQFDDARIGSSRQMGEIRPADISINGGLFHQNLLLLDGVSFNNDLDPARATAENPHGVDFVPAPAQGIAVDTDLLESLTVYDSNVPAAFGGFSGGVVDANTRRASDVFGGKIAFRMSRSVWNELIVPAGNEQAFLESTQWTNQPVYDKYKLSATLEGRTARGIGLIGTVSRTRSDIPLRGYASGGESPTDDNIKEQRRENTSVSLRADWAPTDRLRVGAGLTYAPTSDRYFTQNAKDSWFDLEQGGPVANAHLTWRGDDWTLSSRLGFSDIESSRSVDPAIDYWKTWSRSEAIDWSPVGSTTTTEGNWGNIDQSTRNITLSARADRAPLEIAGTEHAVQAGIEYRDRRAEYHRLNDHYSFLSPGATTSCIGPGGIEDTVSCSLSPVIRTVTNGVIAGRGQFQRTMNIYREGMFEVRVREWSAFVQDDIRIGRLSLRPGLRFDTDDMMDQHTIAPRLAASWDVFGDTDSVVSGGVNRYYGRSFFGMKLREGRENLQTTYARTSVAAPWVLTRAYTAANRFETLDIPYSDEMNLGLRQRLGDVVFNLKHVKRQGRDEILREQVPSEDDSGFYSSNVYRYVNKGRSESDTTTLSVELPAWRWGNVATSGQFAADHTDVRRNYDGYDTSYSGGTYDRWVRYNGSLIRAYALPQASFNRPWSARLSTQTRFDTPGLTWSNFLRYRAGYMTTVDVGDEQVDIGGSPTTVEVREDLQNPSTWTWDSVVEYTLSLPRLQEAYVRVEAQNVLNQRNLLTNATGTTTALYEPGRSYWLEVGYRF